MHKWHTTYFFGRYESGFIFFIAIFWFKTPISKQVSYNTYYFSRISLNGLCIACPRKVSVDWAGFEKTLEFGLWTINRP